jgi:hypothetical protein
VRRAGRLGDTGGVPAHPHVPPFGTAAEDRAADRRFALTAAGLMALEIFLAVLADTGVIALWLWAVLTVVAIGVVALLSLGVIRRSR